jgi:hypothetical protein
MERLLDRSHEEWKSNRRTGARVAAAGAHDSGRAVEKMQKRFAIAGAVTFAAALVLEIVRLAFDRRATFEPGPSRVVGIGLAILWAASAFVVATRKRGWIILPVMGTLALVAHGFVGTAARSLYGIGFVLLAPIAVLTLRGAFGERLRVGARSTLPPRPGPDPSSVL